MKAIILFVLSLLVAEMAYVGRMVLQTEDQMVIKTVLKIPVVGEWFYEYRIAETRGIAKSGDVHEMMALYLRAGSMGNVEDEHLARELLRESGSAAAQLFLFLEDDGTIERGGEREYMLLVARAIKENVRPYIIHGDNNTAYTRQSRQYATAFESLTVKAAKGDRDAKWVLEHLEKTP